jgi:hypothetical protein
MDERVETRWVDGGYRDVVVPWSQTASGRALTKEQGEAAHLLAVLKGDAERVDTVLELDSGTTGQWLATDENFRRVAIGLFNEYYPAEDRMFEFSRAARGAAEARDEGSGWGPQRRRRAGRDRAAPALVEGAIGRNRKKPERTQQPNTVKIVDLAPVQLAGATHGLLRSGSSATTHVSLGSRVSLIITSGPSATRPAGDLGRVGRVSGQRAVLAGP